MSKKRTIKGEKNLRDIMIIWKKHFYFDILYDISEDVTLVHLMDSLGNVNHAISMLWYWIFYSIHKKALCLTQ